MARKTETKLEKLAGQITYRPKERLKRFRSLLVAERAAVFNVLSPQVRQELLKHLSVAEAVELLDHLDLRRAHYILSRMEDASRRTRIIKRLKNDRHGKIEQFLQFHAQAPLSLVHLHYVFLADSTTIEETAAIIEDYLHNTGKIPEVLVHRNGKLAGEVSLGTLVRERNSNKLAKYVQPMKIVSYHAGRQETLPLLTAEPHAKVVVLDDDNSVLGIVYSDDVLDLLGESPAAALYSFAGVEASERPFDSVLNKVRHRYKWLIVNLGTAFLAAGVVALFEDTLAQIVLLAMYMPVVAGMGGNASTQTLAIMVRGIAVGEISLANSKPAVVRETLAGLANGAITGALIAVIALLFNQTALLGLVVGLSVMATLVVAGFFGTVIPLALKRMGKDPATSATIFITTATDVLGFFALLGLAALILL